MFAKPFMRSVRDITIRPAQPADIPQIAALLVQLYEAELPGALHGSAANQRSLLRFTLEAAPQQALRDRFVACAASGEIVATGMLQRPTDPSFDRAPAGTMPMALTLLGYRATAQLLLTVTRSLVGVHQQRVPDAVLLHSVVVDAQQRGNGIGQYLIHTLEQIAAAQNYRLVFLQVLAHNAPARRLYAQLGYRDVWQTSRWVRLVSWDSYVMQKDVSAIAASAHT